MRINLKTFAMLTVLLSAVGFFLGLSTITELRIMGHVLMVLGLYLMVQIKEERKRLRKRHQFYNRMGKIIEKQLYV